jgi:hypothetical protein
MAKTLVADIDTKVISLSSANADRLVYSNYYLPYLLTYADGVTPILPFYRKQDLLNLARYGGMKPEDIQGYMDQLGLGETWALNKLDVANRHLPVIEPVAPAPPPPADGAKRPAIHRPDIAVKVIPRPTVLENQNLEFIAGLLRSDLGFAFLDRTRIRPVGFALGEHVYSLGLAPGEQVVIEQKTFSKREMTYEQQDEQEQQFDIELASTYSTALEEGYERQRNASDTWGLSLSHTGTYTSPTGTWGTFNASHTLGYTKNVSDAHQESAKRSVKDSVTSSSKVAAKYRTQHKTAFKLATEQTFESTSKRTVTNPNKVTPVTLNYFKIMQLLELRQERYGVRLCWAPTLKDPALSFSEKIRNGRQAIMDAATASVPAQPEEPKPSTDAGGASTTNVQTTWVESGIVTADKWGSTGDMRAEYTVALGKPDGYVWDSDVDAIGDSLQLITARDLTTLAYYLYGTPYMTNEGGGDKLAVTVHIGAPSWIGGPGIQFQLGARFKEEVTLTAQDNNDSKYQDDLAAYRTALSDWAQKRDDIIAQALKDADAFEANMMQALSPINEMLSQIIEQRFPANVRDECWEIDYWQRLFDWERASFAAYPSWWSKAQARDPLRDPSDFLNASWAKLYLPVRAGMELLALRWIYGKSVVTKLARDVERQFTVLMKDMADFRTKYFGSADEADDLNKECQAVEDRTYCLACWKETMPTDGTHIEVVQGLTSAADDITSQEIADAAALRAALIDNEKKRSALKDKAANQMTEAAKIIVAVGDETGAPTAEI